MIYDAKGVAFEDEKGVLKIFHAKSERGKATQRGFCGECGSVLFNHVSEVSWVTTLGACFCVSSFGNGAM